MYKYIDESRIEIYHGQPIIIDDTRYSNIADESVLRSAGYKSLTETESPEYDTETQMLVPHYADGETITVTYTVEAIPPVPVQPPTELERIDAIEYMLIELLNFM